MAARNKSKADEAIAKLKREGLGPGNGDIIWLDLNLVDPRNAKKAAQEFMGKEQRLDVISKLLCVFRILQTVDEVAPLSS